MSSIRTILDPLEIREAVRIHFTKIARAAGAPVGSCQCGQAGGCSCGQHQSQPVIFVEKYDRTTSHLTVLSGSTQLPSKNLPTSSEHENLIASAAFRPGDRVLDLGSGIGTDALRSAQEVGPNGFVYGLDMTDDMIALARQNAEAANIPNVTFLKGQLETIPLPEKSVDVAIANRTVGLTSDKAQVLQEAHRVLAPGGRLALSELIVHGALPETVCNDRNAWVGGLAGVLAKDDYRALLADAGFDDIVIDITDTYDLLELIENLRETGITLDSTLVTDLELYGLAFASASIRARRS